MAEERGSIEIRGSDFRPEGEEGEKSAGQNRVPHCRGHGETDMHRGLGVGSQASPCMQPRSWSELEEWDLHMPDARNGHGNLALELQAGPKQVN